MAASLVAVIFSSLSGTTRNIRSEDPINWRNATLLASTVAPASLMGVAISHFSAVVKLAFATLLVVLTYPTARGRPPFAKTSFKVLPFSSSSPGSASGDSRGSSGSGAGS